MVDDKKKKRKSGGKKQGDKLRLIRKYWYGGKCMWKNKEGSRCQVGVGLELAHAIPTELSNKKISGRSSWERLNDVMNFPERFILLCQHHHIEFDGRDGIVWSSDFYSKVQI
jgi:hypothetical protein